MCHDERGHLQFLDDAGDGVGFARPSRTEQYLIFEAFADAFDELIYRFRLVARGLEGGLDLEVHGVIC